MKKVLAFAHQLLADILTKDDLCIDMTVGNGNDTIFLAKIVKHVYGFDIQKEAIMQTKQRLKDEKLNNVTLYLDNHAHLSSYGFCAIKGIIFNLGYLPPGDKKNYNTTGYDHFSITTSFILFKKRWSLCLCHLSRT